MRFAHPLAFSGFLHHIGVPTDRLFRKAELPVLCDRSDALVPVANVWSLIDSVNRLEIDGIAWLVGQWSQDRNINTGLLARMQNSPNLHLALKVFAKLIRTENSHLTLGVHEANEDVLFWVKSTLGSDRAGYDGAQALALMSMLAVLRDFLGVDWQPREVGIEAQKVPAGAIQVLPATRFIPGRPAGYIRLPKICLVHKWCGVEDTANVASSSALRKLDDIGFTAILREFVETYLPDGCLSMVDMAALVGISTRTLGRRLVSHGMSYSSLVEQVRFSAADSLLRDQGIPMIDVARAVGYGDPSHFSRAFRRMTGVTPSHYREWLGSGVLNPNAPDSGCPPLILKSIA